MVRNPFRSRRETRRRAREAVDSEKAKDVLSEAAEEDIVPAAEAAEVLRVAAAEETAEVAESAARHARRRGRKNITSEDVAQANERIRTAKNVDGADNDRSQIRPCQVRPSD
ncbi:hypothetical protein ACH9L7_19255 (plasmid) [Haloferax sp. S1W]|uniref:hypothetical protein n=1 Tax=Haloferax sp. S1W TaxID=3377110 RepID=UPI0037C5F2D1